MNAKLFYTALATAATVATATPAFAVTVHTPTVETNKAIYDSERPGIVTDNFSFAKGVGTLSNPYVFDGVTFVGTKPTFVAAFNGATTPLGRANDGLYGSNVSYLASTGDSLTVSFAGPVLGLTLGSFYGPETLSYVFNGVSKTITLGADRATSFLGLDAGSPTSLSVTFTGNTGELDIISVQTAAPEPGTWMLMILGFGLVGGAMRSAHRRSEKAFTQKVRSAATA